MDHTSIEFKNWKGESEKLTVLKDSIPASKSYLLIDDILDTGSSLDAANKLVKNISLNLIGAFYILDSADRSLQLVCTENRRWPFILEGAAISRGHHSTRGVFRVPSSVSVRWLAVSIEVKAP